MKKLFGIGLLLASCTSEPPVDFNVGNNRIICGNIEALSIQLNECLFESCHYQVPVDAGVSSQDMNADDGIVGTDMDFGNEFGLNPDDMSVDHSGHIVNLGPECNPNLEEVLDKCHDIFKRIVDCKKGILTRDSGLDFDVSDFALDMNVDNNLNN